MTFPLQRPQPMATPFLQQSSSKDLPSASKTLGSGKLAVMAVSVCFQTGNCGSRKGGKGDLTSPDRASGIRGGVPAEQRGQVSAVWTPPRFARFLGGQDCFGPRRPREIHSCLITKLRPKVEHLCRWASSKHEGFKHWTRSLGCSRAHSIDAVEKGLQF